MMKTNNPKKNRIWLILFILFLLVMITAAGILIASQIKSNKEKDMYEELLGEVNDIDTEDSEEMTETEETDILAERGIDIPEKYLDWDALHEENADIYAWIYVPDTDVDYPVLQHPTDNSYYLNYNIDGTKGYPGCIYTEDYNSKDFSDRHTVIYGHNLKSGLMFSSLHNFEDEELFNEDHYIFIYTEDYVFVYQIFGAYEYDSVHLLANEDMENEYVFEDFIKSVYEEDGKVANIREDIEVTAENQIVTLSTCTSDHNSNRRFLVSGVLLNPKQTP